MRKLRLVESPSERRARLRSEEPGEMVFDTFSEYVDAMRAKVVRSALKRKDLAVLADMSTSTIYNMANGKTLRPGFKTIFGIAAGTDKEVTLRPKRR